MPRDPQDEVRIGMKFGEQLRFGDARIRPPADKSARRFDADRTVRRDDHELSVGLPLVELIHEPRIPLRVEGAVPVALEKDSGEL